MTFDTNENLNLRNLMHRLEALEHRNKRLELQSRRTKAIFVLLLLLAGIGFFGSGMTTRADGAGPASPAILRANGFIVVDRAGVERASFSYNDVDHAVVLNLQPEKNSRINLGVGNDYVGLRLTHGKNDINLGCTSKGGTYFEMYGNDGSIFEKRGL